MKGHPQLTEMQFSLVTAEVVWHINTVFLIHQLAENENCFVKK